LSCARCGHAPVRALKGTTGEELWLRCVNEAAASPTQCAFCGHDPAAAAAWAQEERARGEREKEIEKAKEKEREKQRMSDGEKQQLQQQIRKEDEERQERGRELEREQVAIARRRQCLTEAFLSSLEARAVDEARARERPAPLALPWESQERVAQCLQREWESFTDLNDPRAAEAEADDRRWPERSLRRWADCKAECRFWGADGSTAEQDIAAAWRGFVRKARRDVLAAFKAKVAKANVVSHRSAERAAEVRERLRLCGRTRDEADLMLFYNDAEKMCVKRWSSFTACDDLDPLLDAGHAREALEQRWSEFAAREASRGGLLRPAPSAANAKNVSAAPHSGAPRALGPPKTGIGAERTQSVTDMAVFAVGKPFAVARQQDARPQHTHGRPQKFRKRTTTFVEAEVQHRGAAVTRARKAFPGERG